MCRPHAAWDTGPVFGQQETKNGQTDVKADDRDIHCVDEASARAEAARRQTDETEDGVDWIYLHRDRDDRWVVRRYTGETGEPQAEGLSSRLLGVVLGILDPTNWFN